MQTVSQRSVNQKKVTNKENIIEQCRILLKDLASIRLIQRIARPIERQKKMDFINKYAQKLSILNQKILIINKKLLSHPKKNSAVLDLDNNLIYPSKGLFVKQAKQLIEEYQQLLIRGSFQFYERIAIANSFPSLRAINLEAVSKKDKVKRSKWCIC